MAPQHDELTVRFFAPMPQGYIFVPKGDVYITSHCRKQTQAANQTVFAVLNAKNATIGIRVPASIYESVQASHEATRDQRAQAVQRKDTKLETQFRDAVLKRFPQVPAEALSLTVARAMRKGSGRVGRAGKLDVEEKAELAVRAHIRHAHTDYDRLMRGGTSREKARSETYAKINEVIRQWGGDPSQRRSRPPKGSKSSKKKKKKKKDPRNASAKGNLAKGTARKPRKTTALDSLSNSRRERKQTVRRTRAATAAKDEIPKVQGGLVRKRTRSGFGNSLRDDGNSESDEYEWSSLDGSSDVSDEDDEDDDYEDDEDDDYMSEG